MCYILIHDSVHTHHNRAGNISLPMLDHSIMILSQFIKSGQSTSVGKAEEHFLQTTIDLHMHVRSAVAVMAYMYPSKKVNF